MDNTVSVYNEEDELVANDMETIIELLEGLGYRVSWEETDAS